MSLCSTTFAMTMPKNYSKPTYDISRSNIYEGTCIKTVKTTMCALADSTTEEVSYSNGGIPKNAIINYTKKISSKRYDHGLTTIYVEKYEIHYTVRY